MPSTSVHRFVAWTRLGNKSREQLHRPSPQDDTIPPLPEHGREKENNAVTADPLPSRDSLDRHSAFVGQTNTPRSDGEGEDMDAPKEGLITAEYVTVPSSTNSRHRYCPYMINGQSPLPSPHSITPVSLPPMLIPLFVDFRPIPSKTSVHSAGPGNDAAAGAP
jgi:hypothetical protein